MNTNTAIIETLKKAAVFTEARKTFPILKYARMNGKIEATNMTATFRADIMTGPDMVVEPKQAIALLKLGEKLKADDNWEEYPNTQPSFDGVYIAMAQAEDIRRALTFVLPFQSKDSTRYNINSVLFEFNGVSGLKLVATDGHRLGVDYIPLNPQKHAERKLIVPELDKLLKVMPKTGDVSLYLVYGPHNKQEVSSVMFSWMNRATNIPEHVSFRLVDGRFPDYDQVIPKEGALRTVSHVRKDLLAKVKLIESANPAEKSTKRKIGKACRIVLDTETARLCGDEYGLNAAYVREALQATNADYVEHRTRKETDPQEIILFGDTWVSYALIMPMMPPK